MRILRSITIRKASSRRSLMSLCYKTISSCCSCAYVEILSTWEVWRALKMLELHSAAPRATLTPLSCSPNFPRAQYLDIRTLMHELIVNLLPYLHTCVSMIANVAFTMFAAGLLWRNICLHHICAVQIWCKSVFSSSDMRNTGRQK